MGNQRSIIEALQNPRLYNHPIIRFEVIETHLSFILLTGYYAYKIKKSIDLKFADFSTLEKRYFYCHEELRLNTRLAPKLYLEVLAIKGPLENPSLIKNHLDITHNTKKNQKKLSKTNTISDANDKIGTKDTTNTNDTTDTIEYAIKMVQFDQKFLLSQFLKQKPLPVSILEKIAKTLAFFHREANIADVSTPFGSFDAIQEPMLNNFEDCKELLTSLLKNTKDKAEQKQFKELITQLDIIEEKSKSDIIKLKKFFEHRKQKGFIRECHGDCHLGNIVLIDNEPVIFDCIEFNEDFRWIDIMNDVAFLTMDLKTRSTLDSIFTFLNTYLEITGDYAGLKLLRFYQIYRAMVRAKVALLSKNPNQILEFTRYLKIINSIQHHETPKLIITYGLSGSGKTSVAKTLASKIPAILIRSDIERNRMSFAKQERYTKDNQKKVYQQLFFLTETLLNNNYSVIVDATFLCYEDRKLFKDLSKKLRIPFFILHCYTDIEILKQRIKKRLKESKDASEANLSVLEEQILNQKKEPLQDTELKDRIFCDTEKEIHFSELISQILLH